jgi:hypothetical protein
MTDRFVFLVSRFLWPLHNLVLLTAVGVVFGSRGVADYTYALALCAPLYFLTEFGFPMFLLVHSKDGRYSGALAWIRIASALATIPFFAAACFLVPSTQTNVVFAVWLLKVGELLFDPQPALIAAEPSDRRRGSRLFLLDLSRVAIAQGLLWYAMLVAEWGIVRSLALVGGCSVAMNLALLLAVPKWERQSRLWDESRRVLHDMLARATPMTVSGALLAFLVSLPRLLADPLLSNNERALFGVAQVFGTGAAILFHSIWLYELHGVRTFLAAAQVREALTKNVLLSGLFCVALTVGAVVLFFAQVPLLALFRISAVPSSVLPILFAALAIQHCVSIYRDTLKFTGQQWKEAQVLVQALGTATATFYLLVYVVQVAWLPAVVVMCGIASSLQVFLSIHWLKRHRPNTSTATQNTVA